MKAMKIKASFEQEVYIDPAEAFRALKARLGFAPRDGFVGTKNGELVYGEDVSYHGSPMYKYKTISNNPKWEVCNDNLFISTKPESNGEPLAVGPTGFCYPVRGCVAVRVGAGAAPLYNTGSTDAVFRLSHHPHG